MSLFKSLVEQASSTIPFDQAKPYRQFNDYKDVEAKQRLIEQMERERELEDSQVSNKIEGLSSRKSKSRINNNPERKNRPSFLDEEETVVKEKKKVVKKQEIKSVKPTEKTKSRPSFMDEDVDNIFPEKVVKKANGILSKICQKSESKLSEKDIEKLPEKR